MRPYWEGLHQGVGPALAYALHLQRQPSAVLAPEDIPLGRAHRRQLADFVEAVRTGRPPRVGTAEARTALSVILAMYSSAATGKPVRLDES